MACMHAMNACMACIHGMPRMVGISFAKIERLLFGSKKSKTEAFSPIRTRQIRISTPEGLKCPNMGFPKARIVVRQSCGVTQPVWVSGSVRGLCSWSLGFRFRVVRGSGSAGVPSRGAPVSGSVFAVLSFGTVSGFRFSFRRRTS